MQTESLSSTAHYFLRLEISSLPPLPPPVTNNVYTYKHARTHIDCKNSPGPFCDQASFRCPTHLRRSRIFAAQRAFITSRLTTRRSSTFVWNRRTFETYDRPTGLSAPLRFSLRLERLVIPSGTAFRTSSAV